MTATRTVRAGRRIPEAHRPGKVLFPGDGGGAEHTKADLVDHYRSGAPVCSPIRAGGP